MKDTQLIQKWNNYIVAANELFEALGRTQNLVGDFAEYLACLYYKTEPFPNSHKSADFECPNKFLYQVKSRKVVNHSIIKLGVIRTWDFHFLIVVLFDSNGALIRALEVPVHVAKEHSKWNEHLQGNIIRTSPAFLNDPRSKDLTTGFQKLSTISNNA